MRGIPLLLLASGCSGVFGLDRPVLVGDAATDVGLDVPSDVTADAGRITKSYVQGPGYSNVHDTWIDGVNPADMHPSDGALRWRSDRYALIRFDGIVMDNEVPAGSIIHSATLELTIESSTDMAVLYESDISWGDTVTYDTFGTSPGVSSDELRRVVAAMPSTVGSQLLDVTETVEAWSVDPLANLGWIVVAAGSTFDTIASSSNSSVTAGRPRLTVTFTPP